MECAAAFIHAAASANGSSGTPSRSRVRDRRSTPLGHLPQELSVPMSATSWATNVHQQARREDKKFAPRQQVLHAQRTQRQRPLAVQRSELQV